MPANDSVDLVVIGAGPAGTAAAITARSHHPGVVTASLLDGSVHAIAEGVDATVWRALGTRAGGEPARLE